MAHKLYCFLMVLLFIGLPLKALQTPNLSMFPYPNSVEIGSGVFELPTRLRIRFNGFSTERSEFISKRLATQLSTIAKSKVSVAITDSLNANIVINVTQPELDLQLPIFNVNEAYTLSASEHQLTINAETVFGAQHALSSLVQLAYATSAQQLAIPKITITDSPAYPWRGLLIDSVRHFIPIEDIKRQLEGMAAAKLNVLHWHLTDDQGWRMQSDLFPNLTTLASDGLFYSKQEVKELIAYAGLLGIRVVPEFGMPGHASAIAVAYPELMTEHKQYQMERQWGVFKPLLDVANPKVYDFVHKLIGEMATVFPDKYLHIGGDEVEAHDWLNSSSIRQLMAKAELKTGADIQNYFNHQIAPILAKHGKTMMGWDEIAHPNLPKSIVIQSWRGHDSLYQLANQGYKGLLSTGFYIDQPQYSDFHHRNLPIKTVPTVNESLPIQQAYGFSIKRLKGSDVTGELLLLGEKQVSHVLIKLNQGHHEVTEFSFNNDATMLQVQRDSWMGPLAFEFDFASANYGVVIGNSYYPILSLVAIEKPTLSVTAPLGQSAAGHILGGEATMWSELVTAQNIDLRIWPRLFVIAETLWHRNPQHIANSLYYRLAVIDEFASNVVGLQHKTQQNTGFVKLAKAVKYAEITASELTKLASFVEPAHYYTRHHIKYLNQAYHQEAPLNDFVDFLAVESEFTIALRKHLADVFSKTETDVSLTQTLAKWQTQFEQINPVSFNHLPDVTKAYEAVKMSLLIAHQINDYCQSNQHYDAAFIQAKRTQLLSLQSLHDEIVIGAIFPLRDFIQHCK